MKLKTISLIKALASLSSLIGKRTTLPILNHVLLESANGRLTLSASNIDQYKSESIQCDGDIESICVNHSNLLACLFGNVETTELVVSGEQLVIKCGSKATLSTMPAHEFVPKPEDKNTKAIGCINTDLAQGISEVKWALSNDKTNQVRQSVHIVGSAKGLHCDAYNGSTAAFSTKLSMSGDCDCMVHADFAANLAESLNRPNAVFSLSDRHAFVSHDEGFYACLLTEGQFPDTRKAFNAWKRTKLGLSNPDKIIEALKTCIALTKKEDLVTKIHMAWSKTGLLVEFVGNGSSFDSTIDGKFSPHDHFANAQTVLKCLEAFKGDDVLFEAVDKGLVMSVGDLTAVAADLVK